MKNSTKKMFADLKITSLMNGIDLSNPIEPVVNPTREQVKEEIEKAFSTTVPIEEPKINLTECKKIEIFNSLLFVNEPNKLEEYFNLGFVSTDRIEAVTGMAIKISGMWIPKSLCGYYRKDTTYETNFLIMKWWGNKNSLKLKVCFDFKTELYKSKPVSKEPTQEPSQEPAPVYSGKRKVKTTTTFSSNKNWQARSLKEQLPLRIKKELVFENLADDYIIKQFVLLAAVQDLDIEKATPRALLINGMYIPKQNAAYKDDGQQVLIMVKKWWYESQLSDLKKHDMV